MFITRLDRRAPATVTFQSAVQLAARDIEVGGDDAVRNGFVMNA